MLLQEEFQEESRGSPPPRLGLLELLKPKALHQDVKLMCESCCHILYIISLSQSFALCLVEPQHLKQMFFSLR